MPERSVSVVVFSGGRGSSVLSRELIANPRIDLTLAINGYDDGMSTGEVRRFLGDALGPSDFRKNASHLAKALRTCGEYVVALLDRRLPDGSTRETAIAELETIGGEVGARLSAFVEELRSSGKPFDFADCAIGNLAFAGCYLRRGRNFNAAVDDYCSLLNLPAGLIENVSDGTNAFLAAIDPDDRLLASEADIVDANRRNRIKDIFLLASRPTATDIEAIAAMPRDQVAPWLAAHEREIAVNPRLVDKIASADLIVYSPGTQHSSLFPSYLTHGLSRAIAGNLRALKLLITNIQSDAELVDATAVDIVQRAVYYLREKGRLPISTPFLITHYLFNDPRGGREELPYVPLGRLDALEDPRLVRISNYEDGVTGRHDAAKVLTPFLQAFLAEPAKQRIAVLLHDSGSRSKVTQTLLELVRAGLAHVSTITAVFYGGTEKIEEEFTTGFPFPVRYLGPEPQAGKAFKDILVREAFDYAVLFESSGMYNGEDVVTIVAQLASGRLDAVWGSRRLSVRDIDASLRLRYRHKTGLRVASAIGSHVLSAAYLVLYGRYVSDTLSGVRGVRAAIAAAPDLDLHDKRLNQRLLSRLLRERAEVLETPVRFYAISPDRVRRTTVREGLMSLASIVWWRLAPRKPGSPQ
ncbi:MAG TPA: 2-phospho-L-lactate transferase CofD family protein [Vicinamibacterales bacterium]|nr:2-phospho-L-lactate transferase CofD family protein [Vicinamibacterales bacterium]